MRNIKSPLLGAAILVSLAGPVSAQSTYRVVDLGSLAGSFDHVLEINNNGQVTGYARNSDGKKRAFLWTPTWANGEVTGGQIKELPAAKRSKYEFGICLNTAGDVAGRSDSTPVLWPVNGSPITLGTLTRQGVSTAYAINDSRQVVGRSGSDFQSKSFLWQNGKTYDLGTPAGATGSCAKDINQAGKVIGQSFVSNANQHYSFLWTPQQPNGTKGSFQVLDGFWAEAINDTDQITGLVNLPLTNAAGEPYVDSSGVAWNGAYAALWNNGSPQTLGRLASYTGYQDGYGYAMNNRTVAGQPSPQVVGEILLGPEWLEAQLAGLWQDGQAYDLNAHLEAASGAGWVLESATDVNDNGWIVCNGTKDGVRAGCVLIPVG